MMTLATICIVSAAVIIDSIPLYIKQKWLVRLIRAQPLFHRGESCRRDGMKAILVISRHDNWSINGIDRQKEKRKISFMSTAYDRTITLVTMDIAYSPNRRHHQCQWQHLHHRTHRPIFTNTNTHTHQLIRERFNDDSGCIILHPSQPSTTEQF